MSHSRPRRIAVGVAAIIVTATMLLHACSDQPTEPNVSESIDAAKGGPGGRTKFKLTLSGTGSTSDGTLVSDRNGLKCTITVAGGRVSTKGSCAKDLNSGTVILIHATPVPGGVVSWTGCDEEVTDSPLSCQITMNATRQVTAVFGPPPNSFPLAVQGGSNGSGTVTSNPAGITCTVSGGSTGTSCSADFPRNISVRLTAFAAPGSYIKAWSGAGCDLAATGTGATTGSCTLSMNQAQLVVVAFETASDEATKGAWAAPIAWPAVAIHAALLPNGKVLSFGRMARAPLIWDPASPGVFQNLPHPADFFCSGHTFLPDGRLLLAGGHSGTDNFGTRTTYLLDPSTGSWTRSQDMQNGRWYPTATTLANGEVLAISGGDTAGTYNLIPEVWQNGTWRALTSASRWTPYYPMMFLAPDGRVFQAGPERQTVYLNTAGTGSWSGGPLSIFGNRSYGSAVMYDAGKILLVGGGSPTATAEVIDLLAGGGFRSVGSMSVARRQVNATLLADGTVLATGGTNSAGFNASPTDSRVLDAERWDPATEQWTPLARMSHHRLYHSTALLLPDGRVLSVGSGEPPASGHFNDFTAEVFSPPYLFKPDGTPAARPEITMAPSNVSYGQQFTVESPQAQGIVRATWIRLSSVTHSFNQNQRMNRLVTSVAGPSTVSVTAPAGPTHAPPGHYMLFLVDANGVPSVAKIVQIG
ncbi:MAG TPA: galactose oxidase-like domain-containing protein [Gemmatimonadales bacterium]|nr:galactose oxidase-like domain-containing protein [Gemmatimonadales bacterium]